MTIGEKIKIIRGRLSQVQFANQMNISQRTCSQYEMGRSQPTFEFLKKICKHFNINPFWLLYDEGEIYLDRSKTEQGNQDKILIENILERLSELENRLSELESKIEVK